MRETALYLVVGSLAQSDAVISSFTDELGARARRRGPQKANTDGRAIRHSTRDDRPK